ncbi:MAG TPA: TolC family protein, partial [Candidatus Sumerlaeia bacterium]|nr:TolC family protein [Candidatus Sumerlaeia bacterium]
QYEKSEEIIRNLENIIVLDIRNSVRSLETDQKRVQVTQVAVDAEKAKLDSEMQRYRVGLSTSYNVLEFQKDYAEALVRHIQSKISFNQDLIELEKAKGTLLPRFGIVDVPAIQQRLEPVSLDEVQQ